MYDTRLRIFRISRWMQTTEMLRGVISRLTGVQFGSWGDQWTNPWNMTTPNCMSPSVASSPSPCSCHDRYAWGCDCSVTPTQTNGSRWTSQRNTSQDFGESHQETQRTWNRIEQKNCTSKAGPVRRRQSTYSITARVGGRLRLWNYT